MPEPRSFLCAPGLKIEAQERLATLQFAQLNAAMAKVEEAMERLERRLWITVYGVAGVILTQAIISILEVTK